MVPIRLMHFLRNRWRSLLLSPRLLPASILRGFDLARAVITLHELKQGIEAAAAAPLSPDRVESLLTELDANGDGLISLAEFSDWMVRQYDERCLEEGADPRCL